MPRVVRIALGVLAPTRQGLSGLSKRAVCLRRARQADFFTIKNAFSPSHFWHSFTPGVSPYRAVQISGATSLGGFTPKQHWAKSA